MIDDKFIHLEGESLLNFLQAISADEIRSIEVISSPASKYEAEGNSGLINIRYKKGLSNSWSNSMRSSYIQTSYAALSLGNTFNYRKNKLSLASSIDIKKGAEAGFSTSEIDYPDQLWEGKDQFKFRKDYYNGRINIDYQISDQATLGSIVLLNQSMPDISINSDFDIYSIAPEPLYQVSTVGDIRNVKDNISWNLNYRHLLDSAGHQLSIDLDYLGFKDDKYRFFDSHQLDNQGLVSHKLIANNNGMIDLDNWSAKIDFEQPLSWAKLSYGAKGTFTKTYSDISFYDLTAGVPVLDLNQTNEFEYTEYIHALYLDAEKKIGSKFQLKLGFRYESTKAHALSIREQETFTFKYQRFFPNLHSLVVLNDDNFLNINYSSRINRPSFWELNPFRWYLNPNSYTEGNPFLQPAYNNNIEITHGYKQRW